MCCWWRMGVKVYSRCGRYEEPIRRLTWNITVDSFDLTRFLIGNQYSCTRPEEIRCWSQIENRFAAACWEHRAPLYASTLVEHLLWVNNVCVQTCFYNSYTIIFNLLNCHSLRSAVSCTGDGTIVVNPYSSGNLNQLWERAEAFIRNRLSLHRVIDIAG